MNLLTTQEAGAVLRLTSSTLVRYAVTGQIPASRIGRRYLFSVEDLENFVASKRRVQ